MNNGVSIPEVVAGIVGGGGLTQLANWLSRRSRDQAYARGLVDKALDQALSGVSAQLKRADERLDDMERHRDECEAELEQGRMDRAALKRQLDGLMAGEPATYQAKPG